MADNRIRGYRNVQSEYVDGSAARKLNTAPARQPQRQTRKAPQQRSRQEIVQRNREKMNLLQRKDIIFLSLFVCVTLVFCIFYLSLQHTMSQEMSQVAALKTELNSLVDENTAAAERLNSTVDLTSIYTIATGQLGMVYPQENQIIPYTSSNSDYVKQYSEIPNGK